MDNTKARRMKKRHRNNVVTNIILCIIALAALTGCIILLLQNKNLSNKAEETLVKLEESEASKDLYIFTQEDADALAQEAATQAGEDARQELLGRIKEEMSSGGTTAQLLRELYPENLVVYSDAQYYFFPISEILRKHSYIADNFVINEKEEISYFDEDGQIASHKGIDVSKYQQDIDWKKVANDGVEYAFLRVGLRGSTEGKLIVDETFEDNINEAQDNGVDVGVYFFTQATSVEEAEEEADFVLEQLKGYDIEYPIVLDIEETTSETARTKDMTQEEWTQVAIAFCEKIKEAGYTPMIYGNLKTFLIMLDMEKLEDYQKWFAFYSTPVYFPYEFSVWQYSSEGTVDGIKGNVDLNIGMTDFSQEEE